MIYTPRRWLPIQGYEGLYLVSDHGEVFSVRADRILLATPPAKGYPTVSLHNANRRQATAKIHRLVLASFSGKAPSPDHECDHIDGDRANNHLSNLRWVTAKENINNTIDLNGGRPWHRGEKNPRAKLTEPQVRLLRCMRAMNISASYATLSRAWGINEHTISKASRGESWNLLSSPLGFAGGCE